MVDLDRELERACSLYDGENFAKLSERDRVLVTIWAIEAEVNNGGFDQFFFNGAGELAFYAPTALEIIGATRMARIAASANAFFGEGGPPRNHKERQDRLFAITSDHEDFFDHLDREFLAYPDDITSLLAAYLDSHHPRDSSRHVLPGEP